MGKAVEDIAGGVDLASAANHAGAEAAARNEDAHLGLRHTAAPRHGGEMMRSVMEGERARHGGADWLADALKAARADTLATFAIVEQHHGLTVVHRDTLNPPLWELGHIGWFQEVWIGRNPQRSLGSAADPEAPRAPAHRPQADAWYDSSTVPHASRWALPLPDATATRLDLAQQLERTQQALSAVPDDDAALYFFRLALLHEDMHHEAALYMAQSLGVAIDDLRWQPQALCTPAVQLPLEPGPWLLGHEGPGFVFDNERGAHEVAVEAAAAIDSQVLCWHDYLPFIEAGGYRQPIWWSDAGRRWLAAHGRDAPRTMRRGAGRPMSARWQQWRHGAWQPLALDLPACHLSFFEAQAWCCWAKRALPTEVQWEQAAYAHGDAFKWGQVWEWTADAFAPYPGFQPHPYRDYSAPWFHSRRVLRGASFMTQPRMHHRKYRNFFEPQRNDIAAGFRTCALASERSPPWAPAGAELNP